ncbi:toluene tolerance protein [Burkholderia ubonensis]|uniref:Toluene tolerance protein n=1 Tax=Burkholderia ubonensis TaxID=101571 RepID=A0A102J9T8_9BURK|nr:ABC transporter substrate-binding protein [Burkholderia ubonensis]AOI69267.1 toluene tolerance protein [Burkholderia ubonensis]KUZ09655.1 toluene tolerance protein [Burkholderia ubonensis]KUZ31133.1 toluene tolerance protein [Burkholderia ubonensis]KUZ37104.1 toluene tolerance protein [Burkholderia ubonensis]KUZ52739.1 toluene tolerance protein [Burkholderia ubonensis]
MKKLFLIPVFAALFSFGGAAYAEVDQSNPQALIKTATQQVLDEVKQQTIKQGDTNRIITIVNKDILPYTDFRRTTQLAMGRHWRTASQAQQQQVMEQFKMLLIRTYSGAIAQLKPDQQIQYPPFRASAEDTDVVVKTVAMNNGQPVQIDYRLYKTQQGWRVYDLNVLGAWLIQTYQQQFNEKIQQSGVDGLIQFLSQRNQELAAGKQAS